jgi:hypothetical protein
MMLIINMIYNNNVNITWLLDDRANSNIRIEEINSSISLKIQHFRILKPVITNPILLHIKILNSTNSNIFTSNPYFIFTLQIRNLAFLLTSFPLLQIVTSHFHSSINKFFQLHSISIPTLELLSITSL